jgi:signal transduction histidine kinase
VAVCSDITRIKELEEASQRIREMFFSSVAHELRTPLNSIIPVIKMIIDFYSNQLDEKFRGYMHIIYNSSMHLLNVIEDALDMSRIENKKFSILLEFMDIREAVKEVSEIMRFQVESKKLKLDILIEDNVPQ